MEQAALTFQAGQIKTAMVMWRPEVSHEMNKRILGIGRDGVPDHFTREQCSMLVKPMLH